MNGSRVEDYWRHFTMKISTVAFFVLVAMCYFPEGEGSEDADPDLSVMFACTRGPHMVGNRGSGRAPVSKRSIS